MSTQATISTLLSLANWQLLRMQDVPPEDVAPPTTVPYRPQQWASAPQQVSLKVTTQTSQAQTAPSAFSDEAVSSDILFAGATPGAVAGTTTPTTTTYFFDAVVATDHYLASRFTDHPVQSGASVTDHIYELPPRIVLEILMSDALDSFVHGQYATNQSKSVSAYQTLVAIKKLRTPLVLTTRLATYENVQIEEIRSPDTNATYAGLRVTVVFKQINLATVATNTVSVRPSVTSTTNKGTVQTQTVSAAVSATHAEPVATPTTFPGVSTNVANPNPKWHSDPFAPGAFGTHQVPTGH